MKGESKGEILSCEKGVKCRTKDDNFSKIDIRDVIAKNNIRSKRTRRDKYYFVKKPGL